MSAIFGILRHDSSPVSREHLIAMAGAIENRGPDGTGLFCEGPIGLGVQRFQTGRVHEPADIESDGPLVITADARIDNREFLITELRLSPDTSDCMIIKHAHQCWEDEAPTRLLGAFGYAVWNREQQTLTIVRDQIGVRPMYIAQTPRYFAFATDSRSLLALPDLPRDIDDLGVFSFFFGDLLIADRETTCYTAIKRLPAAQIIGLSPGEQGHRRTYWSLDPGKEIHLADDREYAEAFRERFAHAVARCIPTEGDVGSTLSGGLDSSSIAAMAALQLRNNGLGPLHTYSGVFPSTPSADESEFSRAFSGNPTMVPHEYTPGDKSPLDSVIPLMQDLAQPIFAPNLFLSLDACQGVRRDGLRILLDGTDGDTTVGHGRDLFLELATAHDWVAFIREASSYINCYGRGRPSLKPFLVDQYAMPELKRLAAGNRWGPLLGGVNRLGKEFGLSRMSVLKKAWKGRHGSDQPFPDFSPFSPDFVDRVQGRERYSEFYRTFFTYPPQRRALQSQNLTSGAIPLVLEVLDRIAAYHQVEFRFPFCDRELIEFCLSVPANQQLREGWTRWILRKAMDRDLPRKICWRPGKSNLSAVHVRGMREFDSKIVKQVASDLPEGLAPFIERSAPQKVLGRFLEEKATLKDYQFLWQMVVLNSWMQKRENKL